MKVSFAGDAFYEPSFQSTPINVHLSTSFVVWGGNVEGLKLGDTVNFWGSQWTNQVIEGEFVNSDDFKGHADPITVMQVCQPLVQSGDG